MAKSAGHVTIEVTVKTDDSVEEMQVLAEKIRELYEMVPDYLSHESDPLLEDIRDQFSEMIFTKRKN